MIPYETLLSVNGELYAAVTHMATREGECHACPIVRAMQGLAESQRHDWNERGEVLEEIARLRNEIDLLRGQLAEPGAMVPSCDDPARLDLLGACNGHPYAKIPWPHYVLHRGADRIAVLNKAATAATQRADKAEAELAALKARTCETCRYRGIERDSTEWCCVSPDATSPGEVASGFIGRANALCAVFGHGCNAHEPKEVGRG